MQWIRHAYLAVRSRNDYAWGKAMLAGGLQRWALINQADGATVTDE